MRSNIKSNAFFRNEIPIIIGAIFIALIAAAIAYLNSPLKYTERMAKLGEEYIYKGYYDRALSCFQEAYRTSESNENGINAIDRNITSVLDYAEGIEDTGEKKEITDAIREFCADKPVFSVARLRAEILYAQASDASAIESEHILFQGIMELCEKADWESVIGIMRSDLFIPISKWLAEENPIYADDSQQLSIRNQDGSDMVIYGDIDTSYKAYAVAVIVSIVTNSVYEGEWENGMPNGQGMLTIWNKVEGKQDATVIIGGFDNGRLDGEESASGKAVDGVTLQVSHGRIQAINRSSEGKIWMVENLDSIADDYIAGVPGFGGSDNKLTIVLPNNNS